jgi:hypothetical protein
MPTSDEQRRYEEAKRPELERKTKAELIDLVFATEREHMRAQRRQTEQHERTVRSWSERFDQASQVHEQEVHRLSHELELATVRAAGHSDGQNKALETVLSRLSGPSGAKGRMSLDDLLKTIHRSGGVGISLDLGGFSVR